MIYSSNNIEETFIPMPIATTALEKAQKFAQRQPTEEKKEQVYYNTIAVHVVKNYMEMMDIPCNLLSSDSWNPVVQLSANVADLKLTRLGHLECRPLISENCACIPEEVPDDRIGVILVDIDLDSQQATLLGFAKKVKTGKLSIGQLQSIDDLFLYLESISPREINLSKWFEDIFEAGWLSLESFLNPESLVIPSFRSSADLTSRENPIVEGAKLIDLGIELGGKSLQVLIAITIQAGSDDKVDISVQLHPVKSQKYLPPNLKMFLLSETGENLREVCSRSMDNYIQLPEFKCLPGENFSIKVALDDASITEHFSV